MYKLFPKKKDRFAFVSGVAMLIPFITLFLLGAQFEPRDYIFIGIASLAIIGSIANSFLDYLIAVVIEIIIRCKDRRTSSDIDDN